MLSRDDTPSQQFEQEALLRRGATKEPPAVLGTREITVDPRNFVTVRLVVDGRKHTSIYLSTDLDLRWRLLCSAGNDWSPLGTLDLLPGDDKIMLIAPGEKTVADLEKRRASAEGDEPRPITLPDERLIDFAQSIPSSYRQEKRETLAHIVEWYEGATMIRGGTQLV